MSGRTYMIRHARDFPVPSMAPSKWRAVIHTPDGMEWRWFATRAAARAWIRLKRELHTKR